MPMEARTETEKPRPLTMEIDQVKQIYDYTKFHIGLYSTLLTGLVAVVTFAKGKDFALGFRWVLFVIIILLLIGGIAGALAASRIVYGPWHEHQFAIEESRFWKKGGCGSGNQTGNLGGGGRIFPWPSSTTRSG
jgi:hypothetical protein